LRFLILVSIAGASPFAYVTNGESNNISVIDTTTDKVTATISVGSDPAGVVISPNGTKVYVANAHSNDVSVIDTATNNSYIWSCLWEVVPRADSQSSPTGAKVYVANFCSGTVSVIDTSNNNVTNTVNVGNRPRGDYSQPRWNRGICD